jgi:glucuronosyltransferase
LDNTTIIFCVYYNFEAHPKIRAFISHGGLLGTQEAVYHGVPMIVIPIFAEQDFNAMRTVERGTGISLELSELTEQKLESGIREVLNNKKYAMRIFYRLILHSPLYYYHQGSRILLLI